MGSDDNSSDDWEFKVDRTSITKEIQIDEILNIPKTRKLSLEKSKVVRTSRRNYGGEKKIVHEDEFHSLKLPHKDRFLAGAIDLVFILFLFYLSHLLSPYLPQYLGDLKRTPFMNSGQLNLYGKLNFLIAYFVFFGLSTGVYQRTLGKLLVKAQVCDDGRFNVAFKQALLRELVFKPISYLTVVGVLWALVDKKHRALHDILGHTRVIQNH